VALAAVLEDLVELRYQQRASERRPQRGDEQPVVAPGQEPGHGA
jgi:hypothetical protein